MDRIRSSDVLDDQPVRAERKRSYTRERFNDVMTPREAEIVRLEERLRDLGAQLEELESRASRNRPGFAADVRVVTPAELTAMNVYSR
jgi:hypothetical protein